MPQKKFDNELLTQNLIRDNALLFYLPSVNKIIEVKSTWTYKIDLKMILAKAKATKEKGYSFEFWVFDDKAKLTIM